MFKIQLKDNYVKESKLDSVYRKISKEYSIIYNLKNGICGKREFDYILGIIKKKVSESFVLNEKLKEEYGLTIFNDESIRDKSRNQFLIFLMNKEDCPKKFIENHIDSNVFVVKNIKNEYKPEGNSNKVTIHKISNLAEELSKSGNLENKKYDFIRHLRNYYDYNEIHYLVKIKELLNLNEERWEKLRKSVVLHPGDVYPKKANLDKIMKTLFFIAGNLVLDKEKDFLYDEVNNLYVNIEGRFPNKNDLIEIFENNFFKNKKELIELFSEKEYDLDCEDHKRIGLIQFYNDLDNLICENIYGNRRYLPANGNAVFIRYDTWFCAKKSIGIDNFINFLHEIKKKHKLKIELSKETSRGYPVLIIINDIDDILTIDNVKEKYGSLIDNI